MKNYMIIMNVIYSSTQLLPPSAFMWFINHILLSHIAEIFGSIWESAGEVDISVIVCGPATIQSSVAKECRSRNLERRTNHPIFHFNSHSFVL